jgi:spore germination protein YaaH
LTGKRQFTGWIVVFAAAVGIVACLFSKSFAVSAAEVPFKDIGRSYASEQIKQLYINGIVEGDGRGHFEPKKRVSRAEFVKMLVATIGIQPVAGTVPAFADVSAASWEYPWVQSAAHLGLAAGTGAARFNPKASISRQEAAVMIVRAAEGQGSVASPPATFQDEPQIAAWAKPGVAAAVKLGLMQGYAGRFRPADPITREEAAVVFAKLLDSVDSAGLQADAPAIRMGWPYGVSAEEYKRRVQRSHLNTLAPRWFFLNGKGEFDDYADASLVEWAHARGLKIWALAGNRFDSETTRRVLATPEHRAALVRQLTGFVRTYKLDGLNLDFENMRPDDRDSFTQFVKELSESLAGAAVLSVDVPPDSGTDWSEPFDYAELSKYADYLVMMGYDEHWGGGPAMGSVSSLPWLDRSIKKLREQVPARKLIIGLPLYTREWYYSSGGKLLSRDLTLEEQTALLKERKPNVRWDPQSGQYKASYTADAVLRTFWTEEARSLTARYTTVLNHGATGVAFWSIGGETPEIWDAFRNAALLHQLRKYFQTRSK